MKAFKKKGRLFKVEFTVWLDERVCLHSSGTTDSMAVYEAFVVDTDCDGWILDWQEQEMHLAPKKEIM